MDFPAESPIDAESEDELAFARTVLTRQDGEETPVECGYCNESYAFRSCRLLLTEDFGGIPGSDERYIFVCENCWWELIGNPRREALYSLMTPEELERSGSSDSDAGLDAFTLVADLKRREEDAEPEH